MKRWHNDKTHTQREWKKYYKHRVESNKWMSKVGKSPYEGLCSRDIQVGRYRKRKAFDCGNPQCYICHSDKFPKRDDTHQEVTNKLTFKEQLKEFNK